MPGAGWRWIAAALAVAATGAISEGAPRQAATLTIRAPRMTKAPRIDGRIHRAEWRGAFRGMGLVDADGRLVARHAVWWIGYDGKTLYFAMRSQKPPHGKLVAHVKAAQRDSRRIVKDDALECWLAPADDTDAVTRNVRYQLLGNYLGAILDSRYGGAVPTKPPAAWNGPWKFANSSSGSWWEAEWSLPLSAVKLDPVRGIRFRLARDWKQPQQFSSTESWRGGFAKPRSMSTLTIDPQAPCIHIQSLGQLSGAKANIVLELGNPTDKPMTVSTLIRLTSTGDRAPLVARNDTMLAPGGTARVSFKHTLGRNLDYRAKLQVASADGKRIWLDRVFHFRTAQTPEPWMVTAVQPFRFQMMYQPYRRLIRYRIDYRRLHQAAAVKKVKLSLFRESGNDAGGSVKPLQVVTRRATGDGRLETTFAAPKLADGTYRLQCNLETDDGAIISGPATVRFKRKHFPWEHNKIGLEDIVVAPFTPVKVEGMNIDTIFRVYQMTGLGLCKQIISADQPLLSAPMSLVAQVDGKSVIASAGKGRVSEHSRTRAVVEGTWQAGPLTGRTRSVVSYDGAIAVTLTLNPCAKRISSLTLNVPIRQAEAPLMLSVGAGLRRNYGGRVPQGRVAWSNLKAATYGVPDRFLPYLWVGGIRRGLAWYADSDRGWVVNHSKPTMLRLVRQGTSLVMQLRLIGAPVMLKRARTIRFYFQATPVKPRPKGWRRWTFSPQVAGSKRLEILGSSYYWGGVSPFGDVYPRGKDLGLWRRLAAIRERHKVTGVDWRFATKWLRGYRPNGLADHYRRSVRGAMRMAAWAGTLIPYTDPRESQMGIPESRVFVDAWSTSNYQRRPWTVQPIQYVRFTPSCSRQDYLLWWYQKMMQTHFASGIYLDNTFLWPDTNTFSSPNAWTDERGVVHPGVGATQMGQLVKRIAVMQAAAGTEHYNVVHMTNAATAPVLSFATINLAWEWYYGGADFQDRFPLDYIQASTMGGQFGTVPLVLTGIMPSKAQSATWITRTLLATVLPNEIKIWPLFEIDRALVRKVYRRLYKFGYGRSDCRVYDYWKPHAPFHASRKDVRGLLLARGGRLLLIVSDFGNGGPCTVRIDANRWPTGDDVRATDAENGKAVTVSGHSVRFDLKKHDFKMIDIASK